MIVHGDWSLDPLPLPPPPWALGLSDILDSVWFLGLARYLLAVKRAGIPLSGLADSVIFR